MQWSFRTGIKLFGAPLLINITTLLWIIVLWNFGLAKGLQIFTVLSISLLIHEYAHVATAKAAGFPADSVTMYIIGGLARIPDISHMSPRTEALVAAAGPISSTVLALLSLAITPLFPNPPWILKSTLMINSMFAIFNMLPIYPMDGGRILRATLTSKLGRRKGTQIATYTTYVVGSIVGVCGILYGWWDLAPIMLFIMLVAHSEQAAIKRASALQEQGYDVDIYDR